jgi:GAF domain-containing protein
MSLQPLPETHEVLQMIGQGSARDLSAELVRQGQLVQDVVPNLVGMSLALERVDLTFTIAATQEDLALLDAIQYAFGGPCVDAALQGSTVLGGDSDQGLLDEKRWVRFARAGAAHGVLSSLSLPVHARGVVVGGVNLYAATPNAFAGKEQRIADVLGAWAPGAVHNADLSFSTPAAARQAPRVLEELTLLAQATGVVAAAHGVDQACARQYIGEAARAAGLAEAVVARELMQQYRPDGEAL